MPTRLGHASDDGGVVLVSSDLLRGRRIDTVTGWSSVRGSEVPGQGVASCQNC